jgi:hypothetical protein
MSVDVDWGAYLTYPERAASLLGQWLNDGELALFVGAGISLELGAPGWHLLARMMARGAGIQAAGINRKKVSGENLADIFSAIHDANPHDFASNVKGCLYHRWNNRKKSGNWASDTLVALGSLMSGTVRGRVDTVLSLNFDSILEMYLRLYGFIAQPVTTFPCVLQRADVRIFHSHGYLPLEAEDGSSTDILLTKQTYLEAIGDEASPRRRMMDYVFGQRRILAVGVSGDDLYSRAVLANIAKRHKEGPLMGFWIGGPALSSAKADSLQKSKLAAVRLPSFRELPDFLFSIARHAANAQATKMVASAAIAAPVP